MAIRDMDVAAAVIGIRPMYAKLTRLRRQLASSSAWPARCGRFVYLGAWEPAAFSVDRSFQLLFMVIIGGLGSIMGSFFGAAFIVAAADLAEPGLPRAGCRHPDLAPRWPRTLELMIFGALIVFFLIVEPHGLARLWSTGKEKLRLWIAVADPSITAARREVTAIAQQFPSRNRVVADTLAERSRRQGLGPRLRRHSLVRAWQIQRRRADAVAISCSGRAGATMAG